MRIIIIGAKGNLGSQLAKVFASEEVFAYDKENIDITNQAELEDKIREIRPEVIINTAAYNAVDKAEEDFQSANKLNADAPGVLAEIAFKLDALFVHYSTDYVFGGKSEKEIEEAKASGGFSEDDQPQAANAYAKSKLAGEEAILKFKNRGLKYYLIRTSKLFGPKGESEAAKPSFFDTMIKLSAEQPELKVVDAEMSCFAYTKDLAEATKDLIKLEKPFGIYHIINQGASTWYEGAKALFEILKKDVKIIPIKSADYPRPALRPVYSVLRNTKLKPMRGYKEALREYIKENF